MKNLTTIKLANAFSSILQDWVGDKMTEINRRNKTVQYIANGLCATHEFCDPNQAMIDAYKSLYGKEPSVQNKRHNSLINKAWTLAKNASFNLLKEC